MAMNPGNRIKIQRNIYLSLVAIGFAALVLLAFLEKNMPPAFFNPLLYGAIALLLIGNILLYIGIKCPNCNAIVGYVIVFSAKKVDQCPRCRMNFDDTRRR